MQPDEETTVPAEPEPEAALAAPTEEEEVAAAVEAERRYQEEQRQAVRERRKALNQIIAALDIIESADAMLLGEARERRAVRGSRLIEQRASKPSLGGLLPQQMEQIAREEASREQGWRNEQAARDRWVADQEDVIRRLCSGQSEENQRLIRAQFNAQRARG